MNFSLWLDWESSRWRILKMFARQLTTNWAWENNFYATHSWLIVDVSVRTHGDHRGAFIMFGLLGYAVDFNVYDLRHEQDIVEWISS